MLIIIGPGTETELSAGDEVRADIRRGRFLTHKIMRGDCQLMETRQDTVWSTIEDMESLMAAMIAIGDHYGLSVASKTDAEGKIIKNVWIFKLKT